MSDPLILTDAEWQLMHEVWSVTWITSSQLHDRLEEGTGWSLGTIKTMLHRLVHKGALEFQRRGNRYHYRSAVSASDCIDRAQQHLLHTVFLGRPVPMLAALVQSARLSGQELADLQGILTQLRQRQPAS